MMQIFKNDFEHVSTLVKYDYRWAGSTHDSRILRESELFDKFSNGTYRGYLLGDSGYGCSRWLLTPLENPSTEAERLYNRFDF